MECDASSIVHFSQDYFGHSWSSVVSYKFYDYLFYPYKKCHWSFDRFALNLFIALGNMDILTIVILSAMTRQYLSNCLHFLKFLSSVS